MYIRGVLLVRRMECKDWPLLGTLSTAGPPAAGPPAGVPSGVAAVSRGGGRRLWSRGLRPAEVGRGRWGHGELGPGRRGVRTPCVSAAVSVHNTKTTLSAVYRCFVIIFFLTFQLFIMFSEKVTILHS